MYPQAIVDLFKQKYLEGHKWEELSRMLNIPVQTMFRWREEMKLPRRKSGAPKGKRTRK